jgi:hypothetical protein
MAFAEPDRAKLVWGELNVDMINTALPFKVSVSAVGEDKQPINNYEGHLTISAVQSKVCLAEGFESGISIDGFADFREGDMIECYEIEEIKQSL